MGDLISVIVPVYNVQKYLKKCVDSIVNQSYTNIEILLINDGSSDDSGKLCIEFENNDKRIKTINKKNGGLSDARNEGIRFSTGTFISFVDSDDWIEKDYIEKLYDLIKNGNKDIAICNFYKYYDDLDSYENKNDSSYNLELNSYQAQNLMFGSLSVQFTVAWGKLYRSELFENIKFPVNKIHEDEFITYKLYDLSKNIVYTNEKLIIYRIRKNSITQNGFRISNKLNAIEAFQEKFEFYHYKKYYDLRDKTLLTLISIYINIIKNKNLIVKYNMYKSQIDSIDEYINENKRIIIKIKYRFKTRILFLILHYYKTRNSYFNKVK